MRDANGLQYFLSDHLGSVVAVTSDTGTLITQQRYLPFGAERTNIGVITQTDLGYTGQRALDDGMGGLMDYKARFYSPALGRFIQPDSLIPDPANPQAWNRFSYVSNRAINFSDPSGHYACGDGEDRECGTGKKQNPAVDPNKPPKPKGSGGGGGDDDNSNPTDELNIEDYGDEIKDLLVDIWNQNAEAAYELSDNGCFYSLSAFMSNATCLDSASLLSQDLATLFSSLGAATTSITTLLGCAVPADLQIGCGAGYVVGRGIHITFFNPYETIFSSISFGSTVVSDVLTDDTYINSLHDWEIGEDSATGFLTFLPGLITTEPFIDAGVDIYASGYNHGYLCGMSTILDCLP